MASWTQFLRTEPIRLPNGVEAPSVLAALCTLSKDPSPFAAGMGRWAATLTVRFVRTCYDGDRVVVRNIIPHPLNDFLVQAFGTERSFQGDLPLYGWRAGYGRPLYVSLTMAKDMVRVLSRVEKDLQKLRRDWGNIGTFGQYVYRVCRILQVQFYVQETRKGTSGSYDDSAFDRLPVRSGLTGSSPDMAQEIGRLVGKECAEALASVPAGEVLTRRF